MTNGRFDDQRPDLNIRLPEIPAKTIRAVVLGVLAIMVVVSSIYTVEPEEQAVVLRFGAFNEDRVAGPGLHFKLPLGIDQVIKVPVQRQLKQEFGFRSTGTSRDQRTQFRQVEDESDMLTGDLNAAVVEWVVQYRIADPEKYLFRVRNVDDTLSDLSEAVMREVVGDRTVNEVITVGRAEIADLVHQKLQALADLYETGLVIDQVVLQDVAPPPKVEASFNEVNEAEQQRSETVNLAEKEKNEVIPKTRGTALQLIQQAEGYALDRVNRAQGDAARFRALYEEYRKAPEVTRKRLYLETMRDVLPKTGRKVVIDEGLESLVPLLNLNEAAAASKGAKQ